MPLYVWKNFYGWISNDEYVWPSGSYYNGLNVDVSESNWIKLARSYATVEQIFTTLQWKPMWMIEWNSQTNRLIASRNWILKTFTNQENNFGKTIYNISKLWDRLDNYWILLSSNGEIYKWTINEWSLDLWIWTDWANISLELTLPVDTNGWVSNFDDKSLVFQKDNSIYVTAWNWWLHNIYELTLTGWNLVFEQFVTINLWYEITYMTNIGDQIIIYASDWVNGKQYFWDWVSTTFSRVIDWYDKPILWGVTLNNIDYVITWTRNKRELYLVNGYQPNKLYWTDIREINDERAKFFFNPDEWSADIFETIWNTIIFPWNWCFYKYGDNKVWLPQNLVRNEIFWEPTFIYYNDANGWYLTIWTTTSKYSWNQQYLLNRINLSRPTSSSNVYNDRKVWTIETLKHIWDIFSQEKEAVKVRIWYKLNKDTNNNTALNIYAKINSHHYANFYTYEYNEWDYTTAPEVWDIYSFDWVNWEVYAVTKKARNNWTEIKSQWLIIHCKTTTDYNWDLEQSYAGLLTKVSWAWQTAFRFYRSDYWYKYLKTITDATKNSDTFMLRDKMDNLKFNEINFKIDLLTTSSNLTPTFYDIILLYNTIENEI